MNDIKISEKLLNYIFSSESKKIVGICMRRFEIHSSPEDQKAAIKEVIYEGLRNIEKMITISGKDAIYLQNQSEGKNGK